ncbi:RNA polymerase sigma factor [Clavibacter sp. Sh2036]|uniref:RNA polymerase sigma factor n=1 Tax=Clavibacter sp. Sh2036 TaxID=3397677 RepID=UPI0039E076C3
MTEHGAVVLRVCRAVLGGHADAEDAWSETFLSALVAYPRLGPRADVRAWLVTIAHRKALDAIRARGRRALPVDEVPERISDLGVPGSGDPDLWHAVARLPERQRLAVAYRHLGGLPYAEVAAIVGGTPEAVRRAASDGVASLRRTMADDPRGAASARVGAADPPDPDESPAPGPAAPSDPAESPAPAAAPTRGGRP